MANPLHDLKYQIFREMLTNARASKGMLQSEVADQLGKAQAFVSKYERGERRIDLPEFLEIAAVLDIDVSKFIKEYRRRLADVS